MMGESSGPGEQTAYCPSCDEVVEITATVPWQSDLCATCSNRLPDPHDEAL